MALRWLVAVLSCCALGMAQAATYAYRNQAFSYDAPSASAATVAWHASGAAPACTSFPNGDDDWADVSFPAGFQFTFGGTAYTGVRIYSNGILAFGNDASGFHRDYTPQALPITAAGPAGPTGCPNAVPVNLMLPYWIDIVAGTANSTTGASVRHELLGTAPSRRFVISWVNVKLYNQTARYNFQVVLHESAAGVNGNFEYRYTSGSSNGANATVGVQLSTADYTQYSYNQQFIDTTNGTSILWYPANQLATKGAEYRFDESVWVGTAGEVRDTSGNAQHGQRVGNAANILNGKLCRGGSFTNNTSNATIDAVATPLVPGRSGSVSFWYRSNNNWNTADTMLFDATATANRPFFLMKRSNGALRFAVADSAGTVVTAETGNQSFAANTWQHIGVTWNVRPGTNLTLLQIFINGNLVAYARGTTNGALPALASLYIGDNRTSGVTPSNGTPNGANGAIDEFYVYPIDVSGPQFQADMALTRPVCTALDHFRIIHNGTASCGPAQVTVEAHDANHALFSLAGTTMTISTSTGHGSWSAVSAINPVNNIAPGTATYTFANESRIVLALADPYAETLNINIDSGGITEHTGAASICTAADYTHGSVCDANLTFAPCVSSFECLESGLTYQNLTTSPTARNPLYTKLAGAAFSFDVVAVDADGNRVTSYAADADKTVTVELIDGAAGGACASRPALSSPISTPLTFAKTSQPAEQGRKSVSFTVNRAYPNLRCRVADASQTPAVVGCSSDAFAIRPGTLTIPWDWASPPSATATPTIAAGETFQVRATTATAPGDNYTGALSLDISKLAAQIASQDATVETGGTVGDLTIVSPVIANENPPTGSATYGEVGYLYLGPGALRDDSFTAVDRGVGDCIAFDPLNPGNTDYLSTSLVGGKYGCSIGNQTAVSFGRFTPYTFDTEVTHACGSFTYSGQPFPLKVRAKNKSGGTTLNYTGKFANTLTFLDANGATGVFSPTTLAATSFANGVADLTTPPSVSFAFANKLTAPATLKLRVQKAGAENSSLGSEGTTPLRSGRLRLSNAFGATSPLSMPIEAQYWSGASWIKNADDGCTSLTGIFSAPPSGWAWPASGSSTTLSGGSGTLKIAGPTSATATVTASGVPDWLKSKWNNSPNYDQAPSAKATLGVQSPETKRTVHVREVH